MHRRLTWAQLMHVGIPALFVTRPTRGLTGPNIGDPYPAPAKRNKRDLLRACMLYSRGCIGSQADLEITINKKRRFARPAAESPEPLPIAVKEMEASPLLPPPPPVSEKKEQEDVLDRPKGRNKRV